MSGSGKPKFIFVWPVWVAMDSFHSAFYVLPSSTSVYVAPSSSSVYVNPNATYAQGANGGVAYSNGNATYAHEANGSRQLY
ncbi:MAG: hypothetical protein RIQ94_753 [Pseudomonadota bacterium]